ncbi:MAG TPA: HIT family protein [Chitinophagaceae bacterium]|nr:HIT family protein [Chitinophagaceae bacterium]HMZ46800.1 HIT family protein [Chitinophagaceae bacterium]HNE93402.1 HIT family protein [Chitinophagaceae bacterium]HNF29342.1 HIT family protein [Chitinophagaceae bacterium]HNJ59153.1 HIT family protein [Chitinophagaceae bacterium]
MSIFSKIIAGKIPCFKIAEDENFLAFLDIFPVQYGHTLIIPKIEIDKLFDLPNEYLSTILVFAKPVAQAIQKAYPCNRVNIITVGLEVPHAHIHLIATNGLKDVDLNKPKLKLTNEQLKEVQMNILKFL